MVVRRKKKKSVAEQIKDVATKPSPKASSPVVELTSSGSVVFDLALGGGLPWGKIVNLVGDKSTGKTLLALEAIARARKEFGNKLKWRYNDAEAGFSFDSKSMYGFQLIPEGEEFSHTVEQFSDDLSNSLQSLKKGESLIYILDSLDSLTSEAELKRDKTRKRAAAKGETIEQGTFNLEKQKMMGQLFRLMAQEIKKKKCLLIIISQVRSNIGATWGPKFTRSGGKALDFYAGQVIWLAEVEKQRKKGIVTGVTIKAKVDKNKIGKPFRQCFLNLLFDFGVDDVATNIDYLYDLKTEMGKLSKATAIDWEGREFKRDRLIQFIERENLEEELKRRVIEKWEMIEASVAPTNRKRKY